VELRQLLGWLAETADENEATELDLSM